MLNHLLLGYLALLSQSQTFLKGSLQASGKLSEAVITLRCLPRKEE